MFIKRRVSGVGHALMVLVGILVSLSAFSNDSGLVAVAEIAPRHKELNDLSVALLKDRFDREVATPEFEERKLHFYLGSRGLFEEIESVSLQLDGELPVFPSATYIDGALLAASGGLLRMGAWALAVGDHRLRIVWKMRGGVLRDQVVQISVPAPAEYGESVDVDYELALQHRWPSSDFRFAVINWLPGKPSISWMDRLLGVSSRVESYGIGGRDDPRWRSARYLATVGKCWPAALILGRLDAFQVSDAATSALLATVTARCGLIETAQSALERSAGAEARLRTEASLAIAEGYLNRADAERTLAVLDRLPADLEDKDRNRCAVLRALAQFVERDFDAAARALQRILIDPLRLVGAPVEERLWAATVRYDLALALLASGSVDRGRALLDQLGQSSSADRAEIVLRDRANLTLASHFLSAGQGASARAIYQRMLLEGPYSNLALLGLGWAALAPQGSAQAAGYSSGGVAQRATPKFALKALQSRRLIDCQEYNRLAIFPTELCNSLRPFAQAAVSAHPEYLAAEALSAWQELAVRDPRDSAVRESWTAAGYAAKRAGSLKKAGEYFEAAIPKLEDAIADNDASFGRVESYASRTTDEDEVSALEPGHAVPAQTVALVEAGLGVDSLATSLVLRQLIAERAIARWLAIGETAPANVAALNSLLAAQKALLVDIAKALLVTERRQLAAWLVAARSGLASLNDPVQRYDENIH